MAIIYNHIWHILLFSCIKTDRTKIYEESDIKTNTQTSLHSYPGFAEGLCSCQVWPHSRSLRLKRVPAYPVFRFFWSVSSTCIPVFRFFWCIPSTYIPCVSMMLFCFKYLRKKYFVFFVIFQVTACMPVPHNCEHNHGQGGLGMDGVVRGGASFIDIYILYPILCFYCCF